MSADKTPTVFETFTAYGKVFNHRRDAETWAAAVPRIKACDAYRFIRHLSDDHGGKRPQPVKTEDHAPHGVYLRFADESCVAIHYDGTLKGYAKAWHQHTGRDGEVHSYSSCCFVADGKWEV